MSTARSTANIALIKYWGNRNNELRLPAADSLSMTLDTPHVQVLGEEADQFSIESFEADGSRKILTKQQIERLRKHRELTMQYLHTLDIDFRKNVALTIRSQIPSGIGLASSAAVFSAIAEVFAGLIAEEHPLTREQISVIARLGSGSAARSVFGGFVALRNRATSNEQTSNGEIAGAFAEQIAPESHWVLHDIVIVPSLKEKKIGSTEGHALAGTSPLFQDRLKEIPRRMQECTNAILTKDFEKLQRVAEEDGLDMHEVMRTSTPSLQYLSEETWHIIREVEALRTRDHLEVLYTMDAGPTVHLFCTEDAREVVRSFANEQKGCTVFETKIGRGSELV